LTKLRAYRIWVEAGSPTGQAGEAVKEKNWLEAEKQVNAEVETRAFQFWEQQGRPVGPEGEAASKKNRHIAEIQLLQETEDEFAASRFTRLTQFRSVPRRVAAARTFPG